MEIPKEILIEARKSAKELLGRGYVDDYYDSAASEFTWMYQAGYEDGLKKAKETA